MLCSVQCYPKGQGALDYFNVEDGTRGCPETSGNIPEEQGPQLHDGESLKRALSVSPDMTAQQV